MVQLIWENQQNIVNIDEKIISTLRLCMDETLEYEKFNNDAEISLTFTDNSGIKEQNSLLRGIDKETDVLSFPILELDEEGALLISNEDFDEGAVMLGDILISAEKAVSQAEEYGHSLIRELSFLTVHSMLHLLGYDHEVSHEDEKIMFRKQDEILNRLGITR